LSPGLSDFFIHKLELVTVSGSWLIDDSNISIHPSIHPEFEWQQHEEETHLTATQTHLH